MLDERNCELCRHGRRAESEHATSHAQIIIGLLLYPTIFKGATLPVNGPSVTLRLIAIRVFGPPWAMDGLKESSREKANKSYSTTVQREENAKSNKRYANIMIARFDELRFYCCCFTSAQLLTPQLTRLISSVRDNSILLLFCRWFRSYHK